MEQGDEEEEDDDDEDPNPPADPSAPGCEHYRRKARLVAPCCGEVFACRLCHDAAKDVAEPVVERKHVLDRHAVTEVECVLCDERQPKAAACRACGAAFAAYVCMHCSLFDDMGEEKRIFHCDECGICRVGGRENFVHCGPCGACLATSLIGAHRCVEGTLGGSCPICCENLFESRLPSSILDCGHTLHRRCLTDLMRAGGYKCPICSAAIADLSSAYRQLREEIAMTPMPEEYRDTRVQVLCNDCNETSETLFHVLGLECGACHGFNTRRA